MAKQTIEKLLDDIDGGEATETVTFALDGVSYTIDLSAKNATALREVLAPYQGAGTRLGRGSGTWRPGLAPKQRTNSRSDNAAIRAWAATSGYELSDRGRIPANVVEAFEAAKSAPAAAPAAEATIPAKAARKATRRKATATA
jgi:hypothetical protein